MIQGGCLCGSVRWQFEGVPDGATACEFHFYPACGCMVCWCGQQLDEAGRRRIAVNLRLPEPGDVAGIPIDHFDGLNTFDDLPRDGKCVSDYWF